MKHLPFFLALALLSGCCTTPDKPTTPAKVLAAPSASATLKTVQTYVNSAMNRYETSVVAGRVSLEKQAQVDRAHGLYRTQYRNALKASKGNVNKRVTPNVQKAAVKLGELIVLP